MERTNEDALNQREAEATTDETLSELEKQQELAEPSNTSEGIPAPDSEPNPPKQRSGDEELM